MTPYRSNSVEFILSKTFYMYYRYFFPSALRPVSKCVYALHVLVREKMGSYLSSLTVSMCV